MIITDKDINVLYVDDEINTLNSFKANFRDEFNIYVADSASRAKDLLNRISIHVIIADHKMPKTSGIQFFKKIIPLYPEPVRILITGFTREDVAEKSTTKAKVYRYIKKPWNDIEMRKIINDAYQIYISNNGKSEIKKTPVSIDKLEIDKKGGKKS